MSNDATTTVAAAAGCGPAWFFEDPEAVKLLRAEAETWLIPPTPFRRRSKAKGIGGGTDCVGLCEALMRASGALPSFTFPRERKDYSPHTHNDKILNYLRGKLDDPQSKTLAKIFAELSILKDPVFKAGDLLILRSGVGLWHMPVMLDSSLFIQCMYPDGVSEGDIGQPLYRDRLVTMFRARSLEARAASDAEHRTD